MIQVITSETDKEVKEEVIHDMQNPEGNIRILIATSTISMGVNIRGTEVNPNLG